MKILFPAVACLSLTLFSGCHSSRDSSPTATAAQSAPALASSGIDWTKVIAQGPRKGPDLTLWLKADGKVTLAPDGNTVLGWIDESANRLEFKKTGADRDGPIFVKKSEQGNQPTIRFGGFDQQLVSPDVRGSKLIGAEAASLFIVMLQDHHFLENSTIGWGGCGPNRFNTHFTFQHSLIFQMGDPGVSAIGATEPTGWADNLHVVALVVQGSEVRLSVDGSEILVNPQFKKSIKLDELAPIIIAGVCGTGFKGDVSEILLFKKGFKRDKELQILKYLADKYAIQLR